MSLFDKIMENLTKRDNAKEIMKSFDFTSCGSNLTKEQKISLGNMFNKIALFAKQESHRLKFVNDKNEQQEKKEKLQKMIIEVLDSHPNLKYMKKLEADGKSVATLGSILLDCGLTNIVAHLLNGKSGTITNENGENLGMLCVEKGYAGLATIALQNKAARLQQDSLGYNIGQRCVTHYAFLSNKEKPHNENFLTAIHKALSYSDCSEQMTKSQKNIGILCAERMKHSPNLVSCFEKAARNENARYSEDMNGRNMMDVAVFHGYDPKLIMEKFHYDSTDYEKRQYNKHLSDNLDVSQM